MRSLSRPQQLGKLLELVCPALSFLRDKYPGTAAEHFLASQDAKDEGKVNQIIEELVGDMETSGDVTMIRLRFLLGSVAGKVVAGLVRTILVECEPQFIPSDVASAVCEEVEACGPTTSKSEKVKKLGQIIDLLPRRNYYALAELCAVLLDTSADLDELTSLVGPTLFAAHAGRDSVSLTWAVKAFRTIVENCHQLFGTGPISAGKNALGDRKTDMKQLAKQSKAATMKRREERKQTLRLQSSRRRKALLVTPIALHRSDINSDESELDCDDNDEDDLEEEEEDEELDETGMSEEDVGKTRQRAQRKQSQNPAETGSPDEQLVKDLENFYMWRDPGKVERAKVLFENHSFVNIAQAIHQQYCGALPPPWKARLSEMASAGEQGLDWFVKKKKKSIAERRVSRIFQQRKGSKVDDRSAVDRIIDELIETEHFYHESLSATVEFVKHIRDIAVGSQGTDAKNRLGLNKQQIDKVFGYRVEDLLSLSKQLLSNLEVIDLVRTDPLTKKRAEFASDAMLSILEDAREAYASYAKAYREGLEVLEVAGQKLRRKKLGNGKSGPKRGSFEELWNKFTKNDRRLRSQKLPAVLIMPVQRVPRYELLFKQLVKTLETADPTRTQVADVCKAIEALAICINAAS